MEKIDYDSPALAVVDKQSVKDFMSSCVDQYDLKDGDTAVFNIGKFTIGFEKRIFDREKVNV